MKMSPILIVVGLLFLLQGCKSMGPEKGAGSDESPALITFIELNQRVELKPRQARAFFQNGEQIEQGDRDRFYPACSIEVRELSQEKQAIVPGNFSVVRTDLGYTQVVSSGQIRLASNRRLAAQYEDHWRPVVAKHVSLWLSSADQPNVMRVTCYGGEEFIDEARYPSRQDIEQTFGEFATVMW